MSLSVTSKTFKLNTGASIPAVGLGTWRATEADAAYKSVKTALQNGYRHIDTAAIYGNEEEVGRGIKDSGVPRSEIFVTTKLWNKNHKDVEGALNESLSKLGLDYVDLYLIHWPHSTDPVTGKDYTDWDYVDTYKELQKVYKASNKIKAIGVSNFTIAKIERLLADKDVTVVPAANQVELHPLLPQDRLLKYLNEKGIYAEAYSPLGSNDSPLFKNGTVVSIAKKFDIEPAQVLISWAVQRGTVVLPKSVTASRVISNLKTLVLPDEEFEQLSKLSEKDGVVRTCDPGWHTYDDDLA
ncbi:Glycerol 2-dehydrogenase (NADP(+)) [Yamadazyma tenuis]|uniref:Aldo/keto reductase n=1 Tax=Candida tenuis (strain ATCC 10573 / BCRC 21748 / CBS 615 / JCM 9827 / NBRC 10315 / NRRL Y-1498 / VKM Y-70) TaxID=590646 RepID=G3B3D2_CANTC|nr:Aldo/keto reductase [Yamadazyma tenuis ATCC 10573]XP_006686692.1 uncharacterized protein CANTEDRAFT_114165 [Yamadazyma tenuis ATCC 10573]EGV64377.1 Aldo/keto reductase [Yamadazyma tenuis ATCC 10573]EGV64378.1 hypothetical protein CANTEDRAFT_114165 [Yamadazyma tenuis ATCC 10573]WEJ96222.1 Glycerol 2-dehydrogenase (NADP(+)) [Yamadazyma tenuis]